MREYQPSPSNRHIPVLALLEQVDAVLLYAYAFWCEDQAAGSVRVRQGSVSSSTAAAAASLDPTEAIGTARWKPSCIVENWKSVFGLMSFVKGRAEKMANTPPSASSSPKLASEVPRVMELIVAWL